MTERNQERIQQLLVFLYGSEQAEQTTAHLLRQLAEFRQSTKRRFQRSDELFSQKDIIVITYGDLLRQADEPPLVTLRNFFTRRLAEVINSVHILPFYPYSSDDGFSVIDYTSVNPTLGTWDHVEQFRQHGIRLMFDAVINHVSAESNWFAAFKAGEAPYRDYFISVDPSLDLTAVTRPRALPLLTPVETVNGTEHVWTTFSSDQIDLNYQNPSTLLDMIGVLLEYIDHGASLIRLDAIAYLWKEVGTSCIHLPQTHAVIQLLRAVVDEIAPGVLLITETNVPHNENVSYFGDGANEAHMVYNFSLPPLAAHALLTGSSRFLSQWAASLKTPSRQTAFFNFTASHDGIGVRPVTGFLDDENLDVLLKSAIDGGGAVSSKTNSDGTTSPYELNVTYFDLVNSSRPDDPQDMQVRRFLVSQAIMLELAGVPGIYLHSLLGSRNYTEGVQQTRHPRTINREKLDAQKVEQALDDTTTLRHAVFKGYRSLLGIRMQEKAFHPIGAQTILDGGNSVFAVLRQSPDGTESLLALNNITGEQVAVEIDIPDTPRTSLSWVDLLTGVRYESAVGQFKASLDPYQTIWAKSS